MNDLEQFFANNSGNVLQKWNHYFEIYDRYFSRYRGTDVALLEIGVSHGGSLAMWRSYFGPKAKIYGMDVNPHCKTLEDQQTKLFIGDQEDRKFLRHLKAQIPRLDIVIDDGGHTMKQQIITFEELFPFVHESGVFLCEDTGTSYSPYYGGGYKRSGTFIEFSKGLVDCVNAWFSQQPGKLSASAYSGSMQSVHFYPGVVVVEKRPMSAPKEVISGTVKLPSYDFINPLQTRVPFFARSLWRRLRSK